MSPDFVCWMMGFPVDWVNIPALKKGAKLKMLGNAVVPQVAEAAWRTLYGETT